MSYNIEFAARSKEAATARIESLAGGVPRDVVDSIKLAIDRLEPSPYLVNPGVHVRAGGHGDSYTTHGEFRVMRIAIADYEPTAVAAAAPDPPATAPAEPEPATVEQAPVAEIAPEPPAAAA